MTEQEAQQAQTIAHIRKNQNTGNDLCREDDFIAALLKIVDSQAQKIAEQEKRIGILEKCYYAAMNRFAFDSEENRDSWFEAQNNKREFDSKEVAR